MCSFQMRKKGATLCLNVSGLVALRLGLGFHTLVKLQMPLDVHADQAWSAECPQANGFA